MYCMKHVGLFNGKGMQDQDQGERKWIDKGREFNICKTIKCKWKWIKGNKEGLGKENGQGVRIFIREVKDKVRMDFRSKETLGNDHCYLGLRPTVDTTLIPLCHTRSL